VVQSLSLVAGWGQGRWVDLLPEQAMKAARLIHFERLRLTSSRAWEASITGYLILVHRRLIKVAGSFELCLVVC
jgi:hypothetical protein